MSTPVWWDEPFLERQPGGEPPSPRQPLRPQGLGPLFDYVQEDRAVAPPGARAIPLEESMPEWLTGLFASPILAE